MSGRPIAFDPLHLSEALLRQARNADESIQTGAWRPQTLGNDAHAMRLASATIKALLQHIPNHTDPDVVQSIRAAYHAELSDILNHQGALP
jgi:hypothetical protein